MSGPAPRPRFPLKPLEEVAATWQAEGGDSEPPLAPLPAMLRIMGVPERSMYRWRKEGGLTPEAADRIAVRLGYHPASLWPNWYEVMAA